nr:uncharacterized protein LOC101237479 isoform X1 [Hydra vulgaris]
MSLSIVPASSLKKKQQNSAQNYTYDIYKYQYVLRVNPPNQSGVEVLKCCFQEMNGGFLLVLVCSNGALLLHLKNSDGKVLTKQINWFQNKCKKIVGLCIEPLRCSWVFCVCEDSSLYLIPSLEDQAKFLKISSPFSYVKTLKGEPSCIVWWRTLSDQNIGIVGTQVGELVFVDILLHKELYRICIKERIVDLKIMQVIKEKKSYLLIYTFKKLTHRLLLENPSSKFLSRSSSSLSQACDLGYDTVVECNIESIIDDERDNKEEFNKQSRFELLPQDFFYSLHEIGNQVFISKQDPKNNILEIYREFNQVPQHICYLPKNTATFSFTNNLILTLSNTIENKVRIQLFSHEICNGIFGKQNIKKTDLLVESSIQSFFLNDSETVLNSYVFKFNPPSMWNTAFPCSAGYKSCKELSSFLIVTSNGVIECKPRIFLESYFAELCMKHDVEYSERFGLIFNLNITLLYEFIADQCLLNKDLQNANKFYNLSKCSPIRRAAQLIRFASIKDGLIFIQQSLQKITNGNERNTLSNLAVLCYIEQVMEALNSGTFFRNLCDSFKSFLYNNLDYDALVAIDLLVRNGLLEYLFDVAKARGLIQAALEKLACFGNFQLAQSLQTMLIDGGHAEIFCNVFNGVFIKQMEPDEAVKCLLSQPSVSKEFISVISDQLLNLSETSLLYLARMFDPSRQFMRPLIEQSELKLRKRTGSDSSYSKSSETNKELSVSDIIVVFLKSIIALNACRKINNLPDITLVSLHMSGQLSLTNSLIKSDSISSNDLLFTSTPRARIACGRNHIAFVTNNKELYTWGKECGGRKDNVQNTCLPMRMENLHNQGIQVVSVACGEFHTIALCEEGVYSWGSNEYGQLGVGDTRTRYRPVLITHISSKQIVSVVCGAYHTLAITSDYKVYSWGWGVHGQLGLKSVENQLTPKQIDLLDSHKVIQAAAGYAHSAVLTSQRYVYTFGADLYGQLGIGSHYKQVIPQLVDSLTLDSIYLISCGPFETIAISEDQTIFCWGRNYHQFYICAKAESSKYGRKMASNTKDLNHRFYPETLQFQLQHPITQIFCGNWHYIILTSVNQVYTWGYNDCGQLGHYNKIDQSAPRLVKALIRRAIIGVAVGAEFSVAFDADDNIMAWGRNDEGKIGIENEGNLGNSSSARQSIYCVLAPTLVHGLPSIDDSFNSSKSSMKDYVFDEHLNFPDFSSLGIGKRHVLYNEEAVLLSLHRLSNWYSVSSVERFVFHTKQWYILSFCYELQQQWDKVYVFREKALRLFYTNENGEFNYTSYTDQLKLIVLDLLKKFEEYIAEDFEEDLSLVAMVLCLRKIFDCWQELNLNIIILEDLLRKHVEVLCPLYTVVFFGYLHTLQSSSQTLRYTLYHVQKKHLFSEKLSSGFYAELLKNVVNHMATGTNWYTFLSTQSVEFRNEFDKMNFKPCLASDDGSTSTEHILKDIITHKQKTLSLNPLLILSNAVTTTLAAASKSTHLDAANKANLSDYNLSTTISSLNSQLMFQETNCNVVVFTCFHNLLRYYMIETVIPEFQTRMASLPNPLRFTAYLMARLYDENGIKIPMACPYCVYNNFRKEQLKVLNEEDAEVITSTYWEI